MFFKAYDFNQDIGEWDKLRQNMKQMFYSATDFNQDISCWNVTQVTDFENMFSALAWVVVHPMDTVTTITITKMTADPLRRARRHRPRHRPRHRLRTRPVSLWIHSYTWFAEPQCSSARSWCKEGRCGGRQSRIFGQRSLEVEGCARSCVYQRICVYGAETWHFVTRNHALRCAGEKSWRFCDDSWDKRTVDSVVNVRPSRTLRIRYWRCDSGVMGRNGTRRSLQLHTPWHANIHIWVLNSMRPMVDRYRLSIIYDRK